MKFEGDYFNGLRWNGKRYNLEGKEILKIKDGKGKGKVFDENGNLIFEGKYIIERNGKGKNIIKMEIW